MLVAREERSHAATRLSFALQPVQRRLWLPSPTTRVSENPISLSRLSKPHRRRGERYCLVDDGARAGVLADVVQVGVQISTAIALTWLGLGVDAGEQRVPIGGHSVNSKNQPMTKIQTLYVTLLPH